MPHMPFSQLGLNKNPFWESNRLNFEVVVGGGGPLQNALCASVVLGDRPQVL
jgi:hypothetical protein